VKRRIFTQDHERFRAVIADYLAREVVPEFPEWLRNELVPRKVLKSLARIGVLGLNIPEEYGGAGPVGFTYGVVLAEETAKALVHLGPVRTHTDVVLPYLVAFANEEQRQRWFPRIVSGDLALAVAMTEPGTGSDLAAISTSAVREGDEYIISGAKTFVTGGLQADLVLVVVRTEHAAADRRTGLSLIAVETDRDGFERGRKLEKLGLAVQDTIELFLHDVRVPVANLLGEEGQAFNYLRHNLAGERLAIGVGAVCAARSALNLTIDYVKSRTVFGQSLSSLQNTKFVLAEVATELEAAQAMVDQAIQEHEDGELSASDAAKVKLYCTEMQGRAIDRCIQLFGGYGYMCEYPISRLYADARVTRIYGGTSEVQKMIISKSLGL
jgi:acyl-CoA dehydrogenase